MKRTKNLKQLLRVIYKNKRKEDGLSVGRKINDLTQALHLQLSLPEETKDKDLVSKCIGELSETKREHRFRQDFPDFPTFYRYITSPKNGFTPEDIKEL